MAQQFGGKWEIVESIGEGGQAHAFRVRRLDDGSEGWVLKRLKNPARLGRFQQEIEVLRQLQSKRIPAIEDYAVGDPTYLVYPYIGPTLADVVRTENLTFDEGFDLVRDVAEAVSIAHQSHVLHRDIKPDNVVVDPVRGPGRRAFLIDFGICQWLDGGLFQTTTDEPLGNRSFAPPEFELGSTDEPAEGSDVYGLGKLLYWVLTGGAFVPREDLAESVLARIAEPRGVERGHVTRLLKATIRPGIRARIGAREMLEEMERSGALMRMGVSAVGVRNPLCSVCRRGHLNRRSDLTNLGYAAVGNAPSDVRLLQCDFCGYLEHHAIGGTQSQSLGLWED